MTYFRASKVAGIVGIVLSIVGILLAVFVKSEVMAIASGVCLILVAIGLWGVIGQKDPDGGI